MKKALLATFLVTSILFQGCIMKKPVLPQETAIQESGTHTYTLDFKTAGCKKTQEYSERVKTLLEDELVGVAKDFGFLREEEKAADIKLRLNFDSCNVFNPISLLGLVSLTTIPSWFYSAYDISMSATNHESRVFQYNVKDHAPVFLWLPGILTIPWLIDPLKKAQAWRRSLYRNMFEKMAKEF